MPESQSSPASFLVRPFAALRPAPERAAAVAAPPYDVLSTAEARALAADNPYSFLRVSRAEIELPDSQDPYADEVYARAARNLAAFERDGVLVRDAAATYYVYRIGNQHHQQIGIAVAASVAAYNDGRIRRHELTRPAKETDRVRQIEAVGAITGPVLLVHRADATLAATCAAAIARAAPLLCAEVGPWQHAIWPLTEAAAVDSVSRAMNAMPALYIADGHHRSAAAARVAAGTAVACDSFLAVSFPADALQILEYNRIVRDLNGHGAAELLARLADDFSVERVSAAVRPAAPRHFGMYLDGAWYTLALRHAEDGDDPVAALDVSLLDRHVIAPLLGISDNRTDPRIDFIGGSRGPQAVAQAVDSGRAAVGFTLYPTGIAELIAIADAKRIMPPKSTWFEPKLADGLLSLPLR